MSLDPRQLALQYKDDLNATGAFVVQPDGQVKMAANRGGGYAPPWVWAGAIPPASGDDPQSLALRVKLSTPASDPSSPWHDMYQGGGPFTKRSSWDSEKGTYEGGVDWPTLLGTIGVGGLIAGPAIAGLAGAGGGGGAASAAALEAGATAGIPGAVTAGGLVAPEALTLGGIAAGAVPAAAAAAPAATAAAPTLVSTTVGGGSVPAIVGGGGSSFAAPAAASAGVSSFLTPGLIGAGINTFGTLFGTKMANDAAAQAAQIRAASDKYAADLADAANKRAEQFAREQAENQFLNTEASRRGNYDQWREREGRFSNLGAALGLAPRQTPAYVPGVDPRYTSGSSPSPSSGGAPPSFNANATADLSGYNDDVSKAVAQNYAQLGSAPTGAGSGPTDLAYFVKRINETGGLTDANKAYWFGPNGRIAKELAGAVPPETSAASTPLPRARLPTGLGSLATNPQFWWS